MARPLKQIDERQVEQLAAIGCSAAEIAAVIGCAVSTLYDRFSESIKTGHEKRNASIRRAQFELGVVKKHPAMLIWLGKQHLDQHDKVENMGKDGGPQRIVIERAGISSTTDYPPSGAAEDHRAEETL